MFSHALVNHNCDCSGMALMKLLSASYKVQGRTGPAPIQSMEAKRVYSKVIVRERRILLSECRTTTMISVGEVIH